MKKKLIILFTIVFGFTTLKSQDHNLNEFFKGSTAFYSLSKLVNNNAIVIYDKENKISSDDLEYEYESNSIKQSINIVHAIPKSSNYLLVGDYIVNENLAVISLVDSTKQKYIIYTFKRVSKDEEWWFLLSTYKGEMN